MPNKKLQIMPHKANIGTYQYDKYNWKLPAYPRKMERMQILVENHIYCSSL